MLWCWLILLILTLAPFTCILSGRGRSKSTLSRSGRAATLRDVRAGKQCTLADLLPRQQPDVNDLGSPAAGLEDDFQTAEALSPLHDSPSPPPPVPIPPPPPIPVANEDNTRQQALGSAKKRRKVVVPSAPTGPAEPATDADPGPSTAITTAATKTPSRLRVSRRELQPFLEGCEHPEIPGEDKGFLAQAGGEEFSSWAYSKNQRGTQRDGKVYFTATCWHCSWHQKKEFNLVRCEWDRSAFTHHERGEKHSKAVTAYKDRRAQETQQQLMASITQIGDEALMALFGAAYTVVATGMPFTHYDKLCELLLFANAPNITTKYDDPRALGRFTACLHDYYEGEQTKRLKNATFIGIQMDESTCIAGESHAAICVIYDEPSTGTIFKEYFGLVKLSGWTGRDLYDACSGEFRRRGVDLEKKLVSFSGDGCSAVASEKKGVFGFFRKEVNSACYGIHCASHRLALCVKDAGTKRTSPKMLRDTVAAIDAVIRAAHKVFSKSPKRWLNYLAVREVIVPQPAGQPPAVPAGILSSPELAEYYEALQHASPAVRVILLQQLGSQESVYAVLKSLSTIFQIACVGLGVPDNVSLQIVNRQLLQESLKAQVSIIDLNIRRTLSQLAQAQQATLPQPPPPPPPPPPPAAPPPMDGSAYATADDSDSDYDPSDTESVVSSECDDDGVDVDPSGGGKPADEAAKFASLHEKLTDFTTLAFTHFLADVLGTTDAMFKLMQASEFKFSDVPGCVECTKTALHACYIAVEPGEYLTPALSAFVAEMKATGFGSYKGHTIHDVPAHPEAEVHKLVSKYAANLIRHVNERFPDTRFISALALFNPMEYPDVDQPSLVKWGIEKLDVIQEYFTSRSEAKVHEG
ncbi:hypothetical protein VOLCADRAFT_107895 [Volvox carteri f. nagariensis]|uniref:DUF4371 domain-containing protein n=1 Tax=Volvox carteri f. nagariensis TaxID=3068 RepID=D8UH24_VOLCA|nr:uncharacterized protein VOLCADRAFT_107895 [Volvox carteri f. nagariensis]EFJ40997.1 hypothetical protein VOLCADRAFT_107895 [Volvox carteri f. nagariensis]|eukprot:XP_002957971.1 hypothetical protein VOLCADRAFT_107895 [Volvox carteri f. nagariensis]